jgi:hypothetical protein
VDLHFALLHNILPTQERLHRFRKAATPACLLCAAPTADILHVFTACPRVAAAWAFLLFRATLHLGVALTDSTLLYLAWPSSPGDASAALAIIIYSEWVWATIDSPDALLPPLLAAKVKEAAGRGPPVSIF